MYFTLILFVIILVPLPIIIIDGSRGNSSYKTILKSILASCIGVVIMFAAAAVSGTSLGQQFMDVVSEVARTLAGNEEMMKQVGMSDLSFAERVSTITSIYAVINNLLPGALIIMIMTVSYLEYRLMAFLSRSMKASLTPLPRFSGFGWPRNAMVGFLVIFVLSWIVGAIPAFRATYLYANIGMIFQFVFEIQGLAVMFFLVESKRAPKIIAVFLLLAIMITNIGRLIIFAIGIIDFIMGIRNKISQKPQ